VSVVKPVFVKIGNIESRTAGLAFKICIVDDAEIQGITRGRGYGIPEQMNTVRRSCRTSPYENRRGWRGRRGLGFIGHDCGKPELLGPLKDLTQ